MRAQSLSVSRLLMYIVLISLFLFLAGNTGQYLINNQGMNRELGMLLQGVIFTGLTIIFLYIYIKRHPNVLKDIELVGVSISAKSMIGILLPFILLIAGVLSASMFGIIENVKLNLTSTVIIAVSINTLTAFLYEAFPEEVFIRGLIFNELRKKFSFAASLFLQPIIFVCIPTIVIALQTLLLGEPFTVGVEYVILLYVFGIALQLYRHYTGILWASILFHIVYLEVTRYISTGGIYDPNVALLTFDEPVEGTLMVYLSLLFIIILSIVVLTILILIDRRKRRKQQD